LALAEATVFFTETLGFDHLALHARVFFGSSSAGAHDMSLPLGTSQAKIPEVTKFRRFTPLASSRTFGLRALFCA
jgi:hypothetical protein